VHLLAAMDHTSRAVLAQTQVDTKTNEITRFQPLLEDLDLAGRVVTADAMHTQREHADYLHGRGAHYVLVVKGNQPSLHAQMRSLPWRDIPAVDVTREKGHGRAETRAVKITAVSVGIGFPNARLAVQITRRRRPLNGKRWRTETVYAVTYLDQRDIRPDELADVIRGHWHIENRLHWARTGHGVTAVLRNLAISVHRRHGATNIAAASSHS